MTPESLEDQVGVAFGGVTFETLRSWQAAEMVVTLRRVTRERFQKEKENEQAQTKNDD
jgi:hypothetical protein